CTAKIANTGNAKSTSSHSLSESRAIAKNNDNEALPKISMARSNMSKLNTWVSTLRIITQPINAQTKVGNSMKVPLATCVITSANAKQAANNAKVSIAEETVRRRI